jgi:hypothetical protein
VRLICDEQFIGLIDGGHDRDRWPIDIAAAAELAR